ncbi:MAG: GldG family protein [Chloroflexi bacterium]|nr:GldG family protein [Chloroflexota bacterium]
MQSSPNYRQISQMLAILGLVSLLIGLIVMLLLSGLKLVGYGVLLLGVLFLAIAFVIDFRRVGRVLIARRSRFSTGATVMISIFLGIVIFVNAISIGNYKRFDVTSLAQFTLTSQTKQVLQELKAPVEVLFFYGVKNNIDILLQSYAESLLGEYKNYSDKLSAKFIDMDAQPEQARQNGVTLPSTAIFKSENLRRVVLPFEMVELDPQGQSITGIEAEHAFTGALLEVTGAVQKKVYFLVGHGEASPGSDAAGGYRTAREALLDNLFQVATIDLAVTPVIPDDMTALIIAGPQRPLNSSEIDIIRRYIDNSGWVMILLNPASPQNVRDLLLPWGVRVEDGTVIDTSSFVSPQKDYPLVTRTKNFFSLTEVYFPGATAIIPTENSSLELDIRPLAYTSTASWLDKDFDPKQEPALTEGVDVAGPLALGALIIVPFKETGEATEVKDTRIVVFGDSDFASNQHFFNGNNGELFVNAVNLLTVGKEIVSIERKALPFRRMLVTQEQTQFITYSSIGILPLLMLITAAVVWWRRR